jgi:hypothetical protein
LVMLDNASEVVWLGGYVAGYAAQPLMTNPHGEEPELSAVWVKAWLHGQVDELHERGRSRRSAGESRDGSRPR